MASLPLKLSLLLGLLALPARAGAAELTVVFFDVGEGDSALVLSPIGKSVVLDGGPELAGPALAGRLKTLLSAPVDLLLLTHLHGDHLGGLEEVVRSVGTRIFVEPGFNPPSPAYRRLTSVLEEKGVAVKPAGKSIDLGGGAVLKILWPKGKPLTGTRSDVNANSTVARLSWDGFTVLFAADIEAETEKRLLADGEDLSATVLKVADHGARSSTSAEFLARVKPELAIVSCGGGNAAGHPARATLDRLEAAHVKVLRTDLDGELTLKSDGRRLTVSSSLGGPVILERNDGPVLVSRRAPQLFHRPGCPALKGLRPAQLQTFRDREEALKAKRRPAPDCRP